MKKLISIALMIASPLVAASASAQSVEDALAHYRGGRIEEALTAFEHVRESAVTEPAPLITAHVYLGVIHATMGDEPLARRDFAVALALDPELVAPSELSPSLRRVFDEVRASARRLEVAIEAPEDPVAGSAIALRVVARNAPAHVVAALRVRVVPAEGEPWVTRAEGADARVTVPASAWGGGAQVQITAEALTTHGGVLASSARSLGGRLPEVAEAIAGSAEDPLAGGATTSGGGGSVAEEAWFWILIGVIVAGGVAAAILIPTVGTQDVYDLGPPEIVRM